MFKYLILQNNCVHLEVVVSNQTELGVGGERWLNNFIVIAFLESLKIFYI